MAESASSARAAAVALLESLHGAPDDTPLPVLVDRVARRQNLDIRDTALLTELICGVLRTEKRLWALLKPFLRKPDSLPKPLRFLLLTAAYELLFLDHIPSRATVHQAVSLAGRRYGSALGGVANAVLRALDRDLDRVRAEDASFLARDPELATVDDVERLGSLPSDLAAQWIRDYGPAWAWAFARQAGCRPAPGWRVNAGHPDAEDTRRALLKAGGQATGRYGVVFPRPHADLLPLLERLESEGRLTRQGTGALLAAEHLIGIIHADGYPAGSPLWDACCGRGGKTCALLERGISVALASDPAPSRLRGLETALTRLSLPRPDLSCSPAQALAPALAGRFPLILLDVPCSGTGTLARNPELRLRLGLKRRTELSSLQTELLDAAWGALAPGGLLAYATCALRREENEKRIASFLASRTDAFLRTQTLIAPDFPGQDVLFIALIRKN